MSDYMDQLIDNFESDYNTLVDQVSDQKELIILALRYLQRTGMLADFLVFVEAASAVGSSRDKGSKGPWGRKKKGEA